jgi:hypothetical protein
MSGEFRQAFIAARARFKADAWLALSPREQANAIYRELRRIDVERARKQSRRAVHKRDPSAIGSDGGSTC